MLKKWLSYLLIAVIVMQSVGVMAGDDHQSHQDGEQHLELSMRIRKDMYGLAIRQVCTILSVHLSTAQS